MRYGEDYLGEVVEFEPFPCHAFGALQGSRGMRTALLDNGPGSARESLDHLTTRSSAPLALPARFFADLE